MDIKKVADTILELLKQQEEAHASGMYLNHDTGIEAMLLEDGKLAISLTLPLSGEVLDLGEEVDLDEIANLVQNGTIFVRGKDIPVRKKFNVSAKTDARVKLLRVKKK